METFKKTNDPVYFCTECQKNMKMGDECGLNRIAIITPCSTDNSNITNKTKE